MSIWLNCLLAPECVKTGFYLLKKTFYFTTHDTYGNWWPPCEHVCAVNVAAWEHGFMHIVCHAIKILYSQNSPHKSACKSRDNKRDTAMHLQTNYNSSSQQLEPQVKSSWHLCSAKKPQNIQFYHLIIIMCSMMTSAFCTVNINHMWIIINL